MILEAKVDHNQRQEFTIEDEEEETLQSRFRGARPPPRRQRFNDVAEGTTISVVIGSVLS
jgi:hypothetical protein